MEGEAVDFQDWELLHKSEDDAPLMDSGNFAGVGVETDGGVLRHDYFSIDGQNKYATNVSGEGDGTEEGSVESDNPSWVDPTLETSQYKRNNSSEFWSDSSSDRSEERKTHDLDVTSELALAEMMKSRAVSEGMGEMEAKSKNFAKLGSHDLNVTMESNIFNNSRGQDSAKVDLSDKSLEKCFYDSDGDDLGSHNHAKTLETSKSSDGLEGDMDSAKSDQEEECSVESKSIQVAEMKSDLTPGGVGEKRIVWWKVPFEVVKYCVFKVSPVWSISMAAAFMGFIILGRRLYKMKQKSQSLKLKVTLDDKKVSQFTARAARLNEAFSVVRRVPVIRPALPAPGMTPWVVMSMR
ncbi:uncharacterized protein LOC114759768 isoform X2 [Neltuma alba]|nr:uncharacterized protein LOC114759768 isoform X2 [Prosopis alba]XP_028804851.1 uncharacterized protein LOC114759768 isoform X2 [Prosopis alba]XP_028804852.1 uncharacterized protein LOC114759768 isoform X2 [Prosopis alba]